MQKVIKLNPKSYLVLSILLGLLAGCAKTPAEDGAKSINGIALGFAIALFLGAGILLYWLISNGKFKQWSAEGINSSKWKLQDSKLTSEIRRLDEDKVNMVADLGAKAWAERVRHPAYNETFNELSMLEQKAALLSEDADALETGLRNVKSTHEKVASQYGKQLNQLQSERKDAESGLKKVQSKQADLEKELAKFGRDKTNMEVDLHGNIAKLEVVQASDAKDKDKQAGSIASKISSLEKSLISVTNRMPELQTEISGVQTEQQPINERITRTLEQITRVEEEQRSALEPLERQINDLKSQLQAKLDSIDELKGKMPTLINSLGPVVDAVRPESGELAGEYYKIDTLNGERSAKASEQSQLRQLIAGSDKGAIQNFIYFIIGAVIFIVLIVILLVIAF